MNGRSESMPSPGRTTARIRILLGVIFLMAGLMKLTVPMLGDAFAGQLAAADIPFQALNRWFVPAVEVALGAALLAGIQTRVASVVVIGIMIVAAYVHVVVDDPSLFPLQPTQPIVPIVVMGLAVYLLIRGGDAPERAATDASRPLGGTG